VFDVLITVAGLGLLVLAADVLVKGASSLASRLGLSALTIGLTVVSIGTSMPELFVSLTSGIQGKADLSITNVLGSNIFNVLVVLGIAAIICPLPVKNSTVVSEIPFSVSAALLLGFLANTALFTSKPDLSISQLDGAIMLAFFLLFMVYVFSTSRPETQDSSPEVPERSVSVSVVFVLLGVGGLYLGGDWVVDGAVGLARRWEVNEALIGLTIVAIGTSLPELTASAVAAYRKQPDIAVGNVVGSNIFNILWILGLTSSITALPFKAVSNIDIIMVVLSSMLIVLAVATSRAATISRGYGIAFVALYLGYLAYLIDRG